MTDRIASPAGISQRTCFDATPCAAGAPGPPFPCGWHEAWSEKDASRSIGIASPGAHGQGGYRFDSKYTGRLTATPVDVTQNSPAPAGEPFEAIVGEQQRGSVAAGGTEFATVQLRVGSDGAKRYDVHTRCQ